ncbi:MAG: BatD family protein [Bacteroidota bacterium]
MPRLSFIVLAFLFAVSAHAQDLSVSATVDETTVAVDADVRYRIEIRGGTYSNVETPQAPSAEGLRLVGNLPLTEQSVSYVNGELTQSISFSWRFRPTQQGEATIGATSVTAGGRSFTTEPISLTVVDAISNEEEDATVQEVQDTDAFIRLKPSTRSIFQNQQLTIAYDLYFRVGVQLRSSRLADSWDAEGFWREDLHVNQPTAMRQEVINGLRYNVVTLKRVAVFPTRAGMLMIEPLRIETEIALPSRSGRVFDSFFSRSPARFKPAIVASPGLEVNVQPLPNGAPASFRGAVGAYRLRTNVDRRDVSTGEPVTLTATVSGRGNIATLPEPVLELPSMVDQYNVRLDDDITRAGSTVRGSKTFTYTLVPNSSGSHTIPGPVFTFFNPESGQYEADRGPAITLNVTGSVAPATSRITDTRFPANDIADVLPFTHFQRTAAGRPLHENWFAYLGVGLPLLLLLGYAGYRRFTRKLETDVEFARNRRAHPLAKKHLKEAEQLLQMGRHRLFYEEINRALLGFIGNRINAPVLGLTHVQLGDLLIQRGVDVSIARELVDLRNEADAARFSPVAPPREKQETAADRAAGLIADIDEGLK